MAINLQQLKELDVEDLQYIERDLRFYELVSLGFLLYGDKRVSAEFILQKLIVLSKQPPLGNGSAVPNGEIFLREYSKCNPTNWKHSLVEALAIIDARKILRKIGFAWHHIRDYYLPHISEFGIYVHPILKALYKMCESLTAEDSRKLISHINTITCVKYQTDRLQFDDPLYLEIFLLDWITRSIIIVGDYNCQGTNLACLIEYFKLNDMDQLKSLINDTIKHHTIDCEGNVTKGQKKTCDMSVIADSLNEKNIPNLCKQMSITLESALETKSSLSRRSENDIVIDERYRVRGETAGYVLIINQNNFYEERDPNLKHLLPKCKFKKTRDGTNVDRNRLSQLFQLFGYTPIIHNNLSHVEILHCIRETVKKSILKDSLIVCILTHGAKDVIYGSNSIPVKIADIQEILAHDYLHNKPKMLLIQACQKDDSPFLEKKASYDTYLDNSVSLAYADMLIALSSIPGTESMRDTLKGSWYMESLCDIIEQKGHCKHMVDILTSVTNAVTSKKYKEFMLPIFRSTLRKDFYLPTPTSSTNMTSQY